MQVEQIAPFVLLKEQVAHVEEQAVHTVLGFPAAFTELLLQGVQLPLLR
jgi:hypothetical protein